MKTPKKIQILFTTNRAPFSRLIRLATWSEFSHCDLICPDDDDLLIGSIPMKGVITHSLDERIDRSHRWAVYEVDGSAGAAWTYAAKQLGKSYDWLGILGIAMKRDWQGDDKWFCSELVAKACLEAGAPVVNTSLRVNRITPQTLLNSPLLRLLDESARHDPTTTFSS